MVCWMDVSEYKNQIGASLAIALVAALAVVGFAELGLPSQGTATTTLPPGTLVATQTVTGTLTATTSTTPVVTSALTTSPSIQGTQGTSTSGLVLSASLNTTVLSQGEAIGVTASLFNSLPENLTLYPDYADYSNVTGWGAYTYSVCANDQALSMAIFQGRYTSGNVTGATPLQVAELYPIPCALAIPVTEYVLLPNSSLAEAYESPGLTELPVTYMVNLTTTLAPFGGMPMPSNTTSGSFSGGSQAGATGYWTGAFPSSQFQVFQPGVYTVVVADVWGQVQFLYFEVA